MYGYLSCDGEHEHTRTHTHIQVYVVLALPSQWQSPLEDWEEIPSFDVVSAMM